MTAHPLLGGLVVNGTSLDINGAGVVEGTFAVGGAATLSGSLTVTGAQTFTGNTLLSGTLGVTGITTLTGGTAPWMGYPSVTAPVLSSWNAHISSVASNTVIAGNDAAGTITWVTDATGVAQNQTLAVVTFANSALYSKTPVVTLANLSAGAASTSLHSGAFGVVSGSATAFSVVVTGSSLTASGSFKMGYTVTGLG